MKNFEFRYIAVDALLPNPHRPRFKVDRDRLLNLAESIRQYGLFQPILVGKTAAGLQIIAGERRWRAAKIAGLKELPAMVTEATSVDLILYFIEENLQRVDVNILEQASAIKKLCKSSGFTPQSVAKRLKVDLSYIESVLATDDLPEKVKESYLAGTVTNDALLHFSDEEDPLVAVYKANAG